MTQKTDEDEHRELHLPFIADCVRQHTAASSSAATLAGSSVVNITSVTAQQNIAVVPILVGEVSSQDTSRLAQVLAPLIASPENVFIISSDFCHWGSRFRYTHHYLPDKNPHIEDAVVAMDLEAIRRIEGHRGDVVTMWESYLKETRNTICGKSPITALLKAIAALEPATTPPIDVCFVHYAKSGTLKSVEDSSVSYASAVILQ